MASTGGQQFVSWPVNGSPSGCVWSASPALHASLPHVLRGQIVGPLQHLRQEGRSYITLRIACIRFVTANDTVLLGKLATQMQNKKQRVLQIPNCGTLICMQLPAQFTQQVAWLDTSTAPNDMMWFRALSLQTLQATTVQV